MEKTALSIFLVAAGVFSIASSYFNWDWYYNNHRARLIVAIFGRTGARIVYAILGVVLIVFGVVSALP
jgi:Immunity protein 17